MNKETKKMILEELVEMQMNCSKISLTIGGTSEDGFVQHECIIINECCHSVSSKIMELSQKLDFRVEVTSQGLKLI